MRDLEARPAQWQIAVINRHDDRVANRLLPFLTGTVLRPKQSGIGFLIAVVDQAERAAPTRLRIQPARGGSKMNLDMRPHPANSTSPVELRGWDLPPITRSPVELDARRRARPVRRRLHRVIRTRSGWPRMPDVSETSNPMIRSDGNFAPRVPNIFQDASGGDADRPCSIIRSRPSCSKRVSRVCPEQPE